MDFTFTDHERALSKLGRDFFEQVLEPLEVITDEHGELPDAERAPLR